MTKAKTLVGLDVHAAKIVAATLDPETGQTATRRLPGELAPTVKLLSELPAPVKATYEAGPTGYGLARELERAGVDCVVCAPARAAVRRICCRLRGARPIHPHHRRNLRAEKAHLAACPTASLARHL